MRINELNLSVRSYNMLRRKGIETVDVLLPMTDEEIKDLLNRRDTAEILIAVKKLRESPPMKLIVEVESRESITTRASAPFPPHTALISITDADKDFVILTHAPEFLLQMKFDDISNDVLAEICGNDYPAIQKALQVSKKLCWFSDEQAKEITAFIKSVTGKARLLICQCEYGESRSAGLAAAVRQFLYNDGIEIFADERYYPNKRVYKKVLSALGENVTTAT